MSYGPQFEFRVPPRSGERAARYYLDDTTGLIPIGAPVVVDENGDENVLGQLPLVVADANTNKPKNGLGGIAVYEYGPAAYAGDDSKLTTYSDKYNIPAGASVQLVSGDTVKVVLRNLPEQLFLNTRTYPGRVFVAGLGATPTLSVGDFLTPGAGDDTSGYWKETSDEAEAWLVITKVDADRGEVEARLTF